MATLTNGYGDLRDTAFCAIDAYLQPHNVPEPSCPRPLARMAGWTGHYAGTTYVGETAYRDPIRVSGRVR